MEPKDYFDSCWRALFPEAESHWPEIAAAYADRAYHNLDHLREMLGHLPAFTTSPAPAALAPQRPHLFGLALIYHDVVYTAGRSDNEKRSADLLAKHLLAAGGDAEQASYCRRLIMATKHHLPSGKDHSDEALLVDLDLAVLARPAAGYDDYTAAIRHEFRRFPGFLYRRGRRKALLSFLQQTRIYQTELFQRRWEVRARQNIARELASLS